ncbi:selenocysteine synthase [Gemmatimonadota bacterium]
MANRRSFLKRTASYLPGTALLSTLEGCTTAPISYDGRDWFREIGVKPFINAAAAYSALGGRNMWPEVVAAMEYARTRNVIMEELQDAVGRRLAQLIGCEAAMVTSGATSAMTLGTAACVTGTNVDLISHVPDLRGMKNEVIVLRSHRYSYDHGVRSCGVRFVEVDTLEEIDEAVTERTAMLFFCKIMEDNSPVSLREFASKGSELGIPSLIDGSNTVPPVEGLSGYLESGFDLAAFSGGKGLRGPYSAGLLLGRSDLIEAARLNNSPNSDTVGRAMKVSKEEILGMLAAVEVSLTYDYSVEQKRETRMVDLLADKLTAFPQIRTEVVYPVTEGGRPHLRLFWDRSVIPLSVEQAQDRLEQGEPSIRTCYLGLADGELELGTAMLKEDEVDVVVSRVGEVLAQTS